MTIRKENPNVKQRQSKLRCNGGTKRKVTCITPMQLKENVKVLNQQDNLKQTQSITPDSYKNKH